MALEVIPMDVKLEVVLAGRAAGAVVSEVCARYGVSRKSFYDWSRRYDADGLVGLIARSRRPRRSPGQTPAWLEDEIVRLRKELPLDAGARSIRFALARAGLPTPAVGTIHRVLRRHGLVVDQPEKRPRSAFIRFERGRPNECWQIDAMHYRLTNSTAVVVFDLIDDHSRRMIDQLAWPAEDAAGAWQCVARGIARHGPPTEILSDNGSAFTARRHGGQVELERHCAARGIRLLHSRPYHPQTCGKVERVHSTVRRWLATGPPPSTLPELQARLDEFRAFYNNDRPHQSLEGQTPTERHTAGPIAGPGTLGPARSRHHVRITKTGVAILGPWQVNVGVTWAGADVIAVREGAHVVIYHGRSIVRDLQLDLARRYQPSGRPMTGPKSQPRAVLSPMS